MSVNPQRTKYSQFRAPPVGRASLSLDSALPGIAICVLCESIGVWPDLGGAIVSYELPIWRFPQRTDV